MPDVNPPEGAHALIVAELDRDTSDVQSDSFGHTVERRVALAWRFTERESFPALRKAAATFGPTAHLGPGKDSFTFRVQLADHWMQEHLHQFSTAQEADAFLVKAGFKDHVRVHRESVEHREPYLMGGGNYLKAGGHHSDGWKVRSYGLEWLPPVDEWRCGGVDPVALEMAELEARGLVEDFDPAAERCAVDPCPECGTALEKRKPKRRKLKPSQTYYFEWYLFCPGCKRMFMVEAAKRKVQSSPEPWPREEFTCKETDTVVIPPLKDIVCSNCGKRVSDAKIPERAVIAAWVECSECIEKEPECAGAGLNWELDPDFPGRAWLGGIGRCTSLGGVYAHIFALRVHDSEDKAADGLSQDSQFAWQPEFERELKALQLINGGRLAQSSLEGLAGEWVVCAHSLG